MRGASGAAYLLVDFETALLTGVRDDLCQGLDVGDTRNHGANGDQLHAFSRVRDSVCARDWRGMQSHTNADALELCARSRADVLPNICARYVPMPT